MSLKRTDMDELLLEDALDDDRGLAPLRDDYDLGASGEEGRFGDRAVERESGDPVDIQLSPIDRLADDAEQRLDQLRELTHPGIADVLESYRGDSFVAVVFQAVDGESLDGVAANESWYEHPKRAAEFAYDVANVLAYLHGEGVLHRDVRPETVVRDERGRVRLLNLGWAACTDDETNSEQRARYTAPEVGEHDGQLGPWTDLYAFGACLYEALTGEDFARGTSASDGPFADGGPRPLPSPRAHNADLPAFMNRVIERLTAEAPGERYQSAEELRWDVETFLEARRSGIDEIWWRPRAWDPAPSETEVLRVPRPDLEGLLEAPETAETNEVRIALVAGESGMGKTHVLRREAERLADGGGVPVYAFGSSHPAGTALVEHLARGALEAIVDDDQRLGRWRDLFGEASPACRALVDRLPGLGELVERTAVERGSGEADNPVMRAVAAWRELFEVLLQGPLSFVWVVDELQEADDLSREILTEFLCRRSLPGRWLMSYTPGEHATGERWIEANIEASDRCVRRIELPGLERQQVARALAPVVHANDEARERLLDWLLDFSGGRPRGLQIAFRQLLDQQVVQFRAGKPRFVASMMDDAEFAESPGRYLRKIWQDLAPEPRELATRLALVGDPVPERLLPEILSQEEIVPDAQLPVLVARRVVEQFSVGDDRWVGIADEQICEEIVDGLDGSERERQHRMLGFALSEVHDNWERRRLDRGWVSVHAACQWLASGDSGRTVGWFARAGAVRLREGRVPNALGLLREAERRADDPASAGDEARPLLELLGDALAAADQAGEADAYYERALESGGFEPDELRQRRLQLKRGRMLHRQRKFEGAREAVTAYLDSADLELPEVDARFDSAFVDLVFRFILLQAGFRFGLLRPERQSDELVDRELELFEAARLLSSTLIDDPFSLSPRLQYAFGRRAMQTRDPRLVAVGRATQSYSRATGESRESGAARRHRDGAVRYADRSEHAGVGPLVGACTASVSLWLGERDEAFSQVESFRQTALAAGRFPEYAQMLDVLLYLAVYAGDLTAVDRLVERYAADANAFGTVEVRHRIRCFRANAALLRGRDVEARELVDAARGVNVQLQDPARSAEIDGIDFLLLWCEGRRRDALELARTAVNAIDEDLHAHALSETLARAARLGCWAAAEAERGEYDGSAEKLLSFAERALDLADERTREFAMLRPLVRCEAGRLAAMRDDEAGALEALDEATRLADETGQLRFQALACEIRARLQVDSAPMRACADTRRARALYRICECWRGVDRVAGIEEQLRQDGAEFAPLPRDDDRAESSASEHDSTHPPDLPADIGAGSTIELSPDETAVEIVSEADTSTIQHRAEPETDRWPLPTPARTESEDDEEATPDLKA